MSASFDWWRNALSGSFGPVHDGEPQPGFYRLPGRRGERARPVALWADGETWRALVDGRDADAGALWTWCCRQPIAYELYVAVAERGEAWPDEIPGPGHNSGDAPSDTVPTSSPSSDGAHGDPAQELADAIAGLRKAAEAWLAGIGAIAEQSQADRAANFAERFAALEKQAEEHRALDKRPVLEAGRAIDARWKPVVGAAAEAKSLMKKALEPFLLAERARLSAASADGGPGPRDTPKAGSAGRRVGLRGVRQIEITDEAALIAGYRDDPRLWTDADVQRVLHRLALDDLGQGRAVPGARLVVTHVAA